MTTREALRKSIEHWERMIAWAKTQLPDNKPASTEMFDCIKEDWYASHCELCKTINRDRRIDFECDGCPLDNAGMQCEQDYSPWDKVNTSGNWRTWIIYAEEFLNIMRHIEKNMADNTVSAENGK